MSAGKKENTRKGHFLFVVEKLNIPAKAAFCAFVNKTTAIGLMFTIHRIGNSSRSSGSLLSLTFLWR